MKQKFYAGGRPPRALLARNEVNVCRWNSTPLLGGSVSQTLTPTSFIANGVRGVLHAKEPTSSYYSGQHVTASKIQVCV
jgi:hypothetical protein